MINEIEGNKIMYERQLEKEKEIEMEKYVGIWQYYSKSFTEKDYQRENIWDIEIFISAGKLQAKAASNATYFYGKAEEGWDSRVVNGFHIIPINAEKEFISFRNECQNKNIANNRNWNDVTVIEAKLYLSSNKLIPVSNNNSYYLYYWEKY